MVKLMSMSDRAMCAVFFLPHDFQLCIPSNSVAVFVFTKSSYSVSGTHVQRSQQGGCGPRVSSGVGALSRGAAPVSLIGTEAEESLTWHEESI